MPASRPGWLRLLDAPVLISAGIAGARATTLPSPAVAHKLLEMSLREKLGRGFKRVIAKLPDDFEAYFAIACGLVVGVLDVIGVTSPQITIGATLIVLAAVVAALHRDRSLREELEAKVGDLDDKLSAASRAFSNPLPYDVISAHYQWSFEVGGRIANVRKQARVRFVHNGIWSILTWHSNGVSIHQPSAHRLLDGDGIQSLKVFGDLEGLPKGRFGKLIALNREYRLNDVLDFDYCFQSHDNFEQEHEWIEIGIETFTADMTIEILWPRDRVPERVWLETDGDPLPLPVEERDGGHRTELKRRNLANGDGVLVEWDWLSAAKLQASAEAQGE